MEKSGKLNNLKRIEIVLIDTQDAANIGSTCRAMKTMGIDNLTLVSDKEYDENRVKTLALHAFDIWENRKTKASLKEAIQDSILAVATTRRHGKFRKMSCVTPQEFAQHVSRMPEGKISVVFGCEADGLTDSQVRECSMVLTIPTSEAFPSLNLSQAVQIVCYSLFSELKEYPSGGNAVSIKRVEEAATICTDALKDISYFKSEQEYDFTFEFLKDQFARSYMTETEIRRFEKLFTKQSAIIKYKN